MTIFNTKNLIFGFIVSVTLIFGYNLISFGAGNGLYSGTLNIKHSTTSYNNPDDYTCTINLSGNPNFSIQNQSNGTFQSDTIYATLKITTSSGTFDIKTTSTSISSTTSSSNLGFNNLGSITLPGYFINAFIEYSSGNIKGGNYSSIVNSGTVTQGSTYTTYQGTESGTVTDIYDRSIPSSITNSSYASYTNTLNSDDNTINPTFTERVYYDNGYVFDRNTIYTYNATNYIDFVVNNIPDNDIVVDTYVSLHSGSTMLFDSMSISRSTLVSNNTVRLRRVSGTFESPIYRIFLCIHGLNNISDYTIRYTSGSAYTYNIGTSLINPLNVIDTREQNDWNTIAQDPTTEQLGDQNRDVSANIGYVSNFEDGAFNDLNYDLANYNINDSNYTNSILNSLSKVSDLLSSFWYFLPSDYRWLFKFVTTIGIVLALLHVGTFYNVKLSSESLKDKPISMKKGK